MILIFITGPKEAIIKNDFGRQIIILFRKKRNLRTFDPIWKIVFRVRECLDTYEQGEGGVGSPRFVVAGTKSVAHGSSAKNSALSAGFLADTISQHNFLFSRPSESSPSPAGGGWQMAKGGRVRKRKS